MAEFIKKEIDLNSLRLRFNAEFDNWQDFVSAVEEFQRETNIKLTITTSRRITSEERARRYNASCSSNSGITISVIEENDEHDGERKRKANFEYKYLKLTCKHYGGYRSTSRGIRPNQKTAKLMCPTYIYGSFDHYKDKFCIKQMVVNCNHELRDEEVMLPKLLRDANSSPASINITSTDDGGTKITKKYIRKRNRNVLKVPLESPSCGTLIVSLKSKIKCNHETNNICEAFSLTTHDLSSIVSQFYSKSKDEQNELILQWIDAKPFKRDQFTNSGGELENSDQTENNNNSDEIDKIQIQFRLPTIDDSLVKVCSKTFLSVLNINMSRVDAIVTSYYTGRSAINIDNSSSLKSSSQKRHHENSTDMASEEVETSIATILTSLSKEDSTPQVLYIDHVEIPSAEDTLEDPFGNNANVHNNTAVITVTANEIIVANDHDEVVIDDDDQTTKDTEDEIELSEKTIEIIHSSQQESTSESSSSTSPFVHILNDHKVCFYLGAIPWSRQENDQWATKANDQQGIYFKIDPDRSVAVVVVNCKQNQFTIKVYNQIVDLERVPSLKNIYTQYTVGKSTVKSLLDKLNSLILCRGYTDNDGKLTTYFKVACTEQNSLDLVYCFYSNSYRSKHCELLFTDEWLHSSCHYCTNAREAIK